MRIIIGLIVFIALWTLFALGYRVTPPAVSRPAPPTTSVPCPPPPENTGTTALPTTAAPAGGGAGTPARPTRGEPCPAVTSTLTVTAVPPGD